MKGLERVLSALEVKYGVKAKVTWGAGIPATVNDAALTAQMKPTLSRVAKGKIMDDIDYVMPSEDFSHFQPIAPTLYFTLGIGPSAPNHSPLFKIDESALEVGVRSHVLLALDYLNAPKR